MYNILRFAFMEAVMNIPSFKNLLVLCFVLFISAASLNYDSVLKSSILVLGVYLIRSLVFKWCKKIPNE